MQRVRRNESVLAAQASTGWSGELDVSNYRHITLVFATASSANLTAKIAGSPLRKDEVDFTSAAAVDNEWDYIHSYNYQTATGQTGDTGLSWSGTDSVEIVTVNTDAINTLAVQVSARSAGSVTVKMFAVTNQ